MNDIALNAFLPRFGELKGVKLALYRRGMSSLSFVSFVGAIAGSLAIARDVDLISETQNANAF